MTRRANCLPFARTASLGPVLLASLSLPWPLLAQTAPTQDALSDTAQGRATATGAVDPTTTPAPPSTRPEPGFVLLDGGGLAPIAGQRRRILVGANALGGYDSAFSGAPGTAGPFSGGALFGAATFGSRRYWLVLQNDTNLLYARTSGGLFEYFDTAAVSFGSRPSRTRTWTAAVENGIGNNAVRAVSPLNTDRIGDLNAPSPDAPLAALQLGTVFVNGASFAVGQATGRHGGVMLALRNSYRSVPSQQEADNTIRLRAEYWVRTSPRAGWGFFEETGNQSGAQDCTTQAGGVTVRRQVAERTSLQLSGGPAVGTAGCVVRFTGNFAGSATTSVGRSLSLYAAGARQLNQSALTRSTWETTVQGGAIRQLGPGWQVRADAGYLHGTQPDSLGSFSGSYEGGSLQRGLASGFLGGPSLALTVRRFNYAGQGATIPNRTQVFLTLGWTSATRPAASQNGVASR